MSPQNSRGDSRPRLLGLSEVEGGSSEARQRVDYPRNLGENNKGSTQEHPCPRTMGLWRSWERASMAWKRSSVRSRPGPPIPSPAKKPSRLCAPPVLLSLSPASFPAEHLLLIPPLRSGKDDA